MVVLGVGLGGMGVLRFGYPTLSSVGCRRVRKRIGMNSIVQSIGSSQEGVRGEGEEEGGGWSEKGMNE